MKLTLSIVLLTTIASVAVRSQDNPTLFPPPTPPAPQPPPPVSAAPSKDLRIPLPHEIIHESVRRAMQMAQKAVAGTSAAVASAVPGSPAPVPTEPATVELQAVQRGYSTSSTSVRPSRTLVVLSGDTDPAEISNAEKDLAIMARILDKAARSNPDDGRRFASGIEVDTGAVFGSSSGARNIILQNYGALFLLSVRYPLIAPTEKPVESKAKDKRSDDWRRATEEIEGSARADVWSDPSWHISRTPVEEFDADKVDQLKTNLLEALKNATHIRALKQDDYITVVVQGADAGRTEIVRETAKPRSNNKGDASARAGAGIGGTGTAGMAGGGSYTVNSNGVLRRTSSQGQSVMTIRVKKSDVDAYAEDKMSPEDFRKKASIQTYFRKPDASNSANNFFPTVR